ncbi:hypothetical protein ABPG72_013953 [Tetrahymena utriculariae]
MSIKQFKPLFEQFIHHPNLKHTFAGPIYGKFKLIEDPHPLINKESQILLKYKVPKSMCNFFGVAHGGALATLIDCSTTLAILKADETRRLTTTIELSQHCLSPCHISEEILIKAECIRIGKTIAFAQAEIYNEGGRQIAVTGRQTKYILPKPWDHSFLSEEQRQKMEQPEEETEKK